MQGDNFDKKGAETMMTEQPWAGVIWTRVSISGRLF
jgi:hypothetical protein